jgi:hypothetical protein
MFTVQVTNNEHHFYDCNRVYRTGLKLKGVLYSLLASDVTDKEKVL